MTQRACALEKQIMKAVRLNYLLYLPPGYGAGAHEEWPMILFLHGVGERGNDLNLIKRHGIPKVVEERHDLPFITVSPQCPMDSWWSAEVDAVDALIDEVVATYAVDPDRIYLTGLSMGGYGTWHLATAYPDRFAAVVPICAGGFRFLGFPEKARVLKDVPVWVFHGAKDARVPVEESVKVVEALKAAGGNVRLTVYPDATHDSWTQTYDKPELYEWFLQHRRRHS